MAWRVSSLICTHVNKVQNKLSSALDQPKGSVEARVDEGFGWSAYALRNPCLKFGWNLLSLKASRTLSKMDDISGVFAGDDDDCGCSWLGLVSLMTFWMVCICSEEALFKIWLKSVEFEGIMNPLKDGWHFWSFCWRWWWLWMFLTGAGVLDDVLDGLHIVWGSPI